MSREKPEVGDVFAEKLKNDKGYLKHRVVAVNNLHVALAKEIVEHWGDVELKTIVTSFLSKKALTRRNILEIAKLELKIYSMCKMIRRLFCLLGSIGIIVISLFWGFFTSLGWALWFNEKFASIIFIGGFITSQIYNEITKGNK